jgi:radical SAM superfamily enzyme YgiQ (UPF0313 family)
MFKIGFVYSGHENIGIENLSAALKKNGFDTKLFFDPILFSEVGFIRNNFLGKVFSFRGRLLKEISGYRPDLLCFSSTTDTYQWACGLASEIKRQCRIPIVFGGIHPTCVPEKVIQNEFVDYVCLGEGDQAVVDLARALKLGNPANTIPNIWAKEDKIIFKNSPRPLIPDLDRLPYPDKDLFYSRWPIFNDGYTLATSRGCPYSCSYCCNNALKKIYAGQSFYRRRSAEHVIDELKIAKNKYKPRYIVFLDEAFNADLAWFKGFLKDYREQIDLPFSCFAYPDLLDSAAIDDLKTAGCFKIQMGLQTISEDRRLLVFNRASDNRKIAQAIDACRKKGIYSVCDIILGLPDDNEDALRETAYFFDRHPPDHVELFWLQYYPGTGITQWALKQGYLSGKAIDEIESGGKTDGIVQGNMHANSLTIKFALMFYLFRFLPHRLRRFILEKRLYRFLPSFSPLLFLYIFSRVLKRARYDLNVARTVKRYRYFIFRKFFPISMVVRS